MPSERPITRSILGPGASAFALGLPIALGMAAVLPWSAYQLAHFWLALRGRLPWRLFAFLEDAHKKGLLRQVGDVYQFRHARLQDRLARPLTVAGRFHSRALLQRCSHVCLGTITAPWRQAMVGWEMIAR